LSEEKPIVVGKSQAASHFDEIIGDSPELEEVLRQVTIVAPSDATVLLLGETGTGKELVARALHRMSARRAEAFIKLNCAAIPGDLLENELFGHEEGAFTHAVTQKMGTLQLADHGTLFLDEIGEMPIEIQPKLLRVLQDQEFEPLGSTRTLRVNIRLIAATNRDLSRSIREGKFRTDLFYRLNVFPIRLPPLRQRRSDIPKLLAHFLDKYSKRMNKHIQTVPRDTLEALINWNWPGNVRELENFVERSLVLTSGTVLQAPLSELEGRSLPTIESELETVQREHIIRVLRECRGLISGPEGAAARLGMKRTTLQSKMERLGISPADYRRDPGDLAS